MSRSDHLKGAKGVFLIMGQWRYGAGLTLDEAKKNFAAHGGYLSKGLTLVEFDAETAYHGVDGMGYFHFEGQSPKKTEVEPGKRIPAQR